uniref:Small integral membrane protein 8 n=1 Tax=Panagrellus redivivus TaxID=6233 RepID=A0A7E4VS66_PANRE
MFAARRLLLTGQSVANLAKRGVHKGIEGTPPMRFMSTPERIAVYSLICVSFLSYPTYLMLNLDNLRPKNDNSLGEKALAEKERRLAARAGH